MASGIPNMWSFWTPCLQVTWHGTRDTCVGWQVTVRDLICRWRSVSLRWVFRRELYRH